MLFRQRAIIAWQVHKEWYNCNYFIKEAQKDEDRFFRPYSREEDDIRGQRQKSHAPASMIIACKKKKGAQAMCKQSTHSYIDTGRPTSS
jgi:hypothetical protein